MDDGRWTMDDGRWTIKGDVSCLLKAIRFLDKMDFFSSRFRCR
ncbi:hypothetical protein [Rhodohalobacter mucosus]